MNYPRIVNDRSRLARKLRVLIRGLDKGHDTVQESLYRADDILEFVDSKYSERISKESAVQKTNEDIAAKISRETKVGSLVYSLLSDDKFADEPLFDECLSYGSLSDNAACYIIRDNRHYEITVEEVDSIFGDAAIVQATDKDIEEDDDVEPS